MKAKRKDKRSRRLSVLILVSAVSLLQLVHVTSARADVVQCFDASGTDLPQNLVVSSSSGELSLDRVNDLQACASFDGAVDHQESFETFEGCGTTCSRFQINFTGEGSVGLQLLYSRDEVPGSFSFDEQPVSEGRKVEFCFSSGTPRPGCPAGAEAGGSTPPPSGSPSSPQNDPSPEPTASPTPHSEEPPNADESPGQGDEVEAPARALTLTGVRTRAGVRITGWISGSDGCIAQELVQLYRRMSRGGWSRIGIRTSNADGYFRFALSWRPRTAYRVATTADDSCAAALSNRIRL